MPSNIAQSQQQQNLSYEEITSALDRGVLELNFSGLHFSRDQLNDLLDKVNNNQFIGHIIWGTLPSDADEVVKQIEAKLVQNNKSYKHHPTDFVHGLLSSHSYQTSKIDDKVEFTVDSESKEHVNVKYNHHLENWRVEQVFQPDESDDHYSVLYFNDKDHHAVLAHRGTDIGGSIISLLTGGFKGNESLKADLIEILNHNIGVQQAASYASTKEALDIIRDKYEYYHFSTTGHSLGAWLAELSLYFCHMDFNCHDVRAVTFDSPGTKDHLEVFKSNVDNPYTKVNTSLFDIVTYLSAPNVVNICNQHIGKVYRIMPEIQYKEILKRDLPWVIPQSLKIIIENNKYYLDSLLSVSGHSLNPMLDIFDPETGKPYSDKYSMVLDWPHIKHMADIQPTQGVARIILNSVPGSQLLPYPLEKFALTAINKVIPGTIGSVSTVLASFLSGNTAISQLCETFRHFDLNTHGKGYELKEELQPLEQFSLSYAGYYRTVGVDLLQDILLVENKGSVDWYLSRLAKCNIKILEKQLDDDNSISQLKIIKEQYKIGFALGKKYIILNQQTVDSETLTVEKIRQELLRLIEVDSAIKDLLENITIYSEVHNNSIAHYLPERIHNFIGREKVFTQIDEILSIDTNQCVAINAFAGTGKSSTALEYGHREQDKNQKKGTAKIVRWFDSDTSDKIEISYRNLAESLGIDKTRDKKILINLVNDAITRLDKPMLFIFDNLENYQDAEEYLTNLPRKLVKVIITTRDDNLLGNLKQHIRLEPFSRKDAEKYININLPGRANDRNTKDLIETLGNKEGDVLPYRLEKAVAYLKEKNLCSIENYIKNIKENPDDKIVTAMLLQLVDTSPLAWQILQYSAHLDPDSISIEIFKQLLRADEIILQDPITQLKKLSLIDLYYSDGKPYLKIHRLAQDEIIKYIPRHPENSVSVNNIYENLIVSLNKLMPKVTNLPDEKWQESSLYYIHISKILSTNKDIVLVKQAELYMKLGEYNKHINYSFSQSLADHLKTLEIYQALYQGNHSSVAMSLNNVGSAYETLGDVKKGLVYQEQALVMYQALYQGNHSSVAMSLNGVGIAYEALGDVKKGLVHLGFGNVSSTIPR